MHSGPEILHLTARTFIGLEATFISAMSPEANNLQVIPPLWDAFDQRMSSDGPTLVEAGVSYGLCVHPDALGRSSSHRHELLYLAAVQVSPGTPPPHGMTTWVAPAGSYARFTHIGEVAKIGETMGYIYGTWLPHSHFQRGHGPDVERMDARFHPHRADSVLEIFIPIAPSSAKT